MTPGSATSLCRGSIRVRSGPARCTNTVARPRTDLPLKGEPMATNLPLGVRELPLYRDGFRVGQDTGLRIALDALTAERNRQVDTRPDSRAYADGCLLAVSKVLAGRFRQENQ
jgi:hypothetical protein